MNEQDDFTVNALQIYGWISQEKTRLENKIDQLKRDGFKESDKPIELIKNQIRALNWLEGKVKQIDPNYR